MKKAESDQNEIMNEWCLHHGRGYYKGFNHVRRYRSGNTWEAWVVEDGSGKRLSFLYQAEAKIMDRAWLSAQESNVPADDLDKAARRGFSDHVKRLEGIVERTKGLSHKNVGEVMGLTIDRERDQVVLVEEYIPGIELDRVVAQITPEVSIYLYTQTLEGLKYIHNNGLLHLNIKPERIFVDVEHKDKPVKITDFGSAIPLHGYEGAYNCYTAYYAAPEVVLGLRDKIDQRADLFSLGVTMYRCLTGHQPFFDRATAGRDKKRLRSIVEREKEVSVPPSHYNKEVPPEMDELVLNLLKRDPEQRAFRNAENVLSYVYEQWPEASRRFLSVSTATIEWSDEDKDK